MNHNIQKNESKTPVIFDSSDGQDLRINMISPWLKKCFGCKIIKLAVDGGFTCPNRDGTKGTGGCLFCSESGSGDMASKATDPASIHRALDEQITLLSRKWPEARYIAYFQSHTNTYSSIRDLRQKFEAALSHPGVVGLAIATRPDCLPDDVVSLLAELNHKTFMWVELGLQTIHDSIAKEMNLCHDLSDYDDAVNKLRSRNIRLVTHLILGLPGETKEMMMDSVRYVCRSLPESISTADKHTPLNDEVSIASHGTDNTEAGNPSDVPSEAPANNMSNIRPDSAALTDSDALPGSDAPTDYPANVHTDSCTSSSHIFGLKLHMLNVVKGSGLAFRYPDYVPFESMEEYIDILIKAIEIIPEDITIHRISGDAPRSSLISPEWSYKKRTILNNIHKEMRARNTWQGRLL